jgi:hypothetical protein
MGIIDTFESFAADFEAAVADDNWSRLEQYLAMDATYLNVGGPDPKIEGRRAILTFLQADVRDSDRRFDSRTLVALTPPTANGNRLSRQWRCTYTLAGAPDLAIEGEARYLFEGNMIKAIEEQPTPASMQLLDEWMRTYGDRLHS